MDNINVVVLIVAIVFVAAGVALIALSAVVGRGTPDGSRPAKPAEKLPGEAAGDEDDVLFIDEPMTTDLAEQLAEPERGRRAGTAATGIGAPATDEPAVEAPPAATVEAPPAPTVEAPRAAEAGTAIAAVTAEAASPRPQPAELASPAGPVEVADSSGVAPTDEPATATADGPSPGVEAASTAGLDPRKADAYDFSVQLGFKYLDNRLFPEAAAEFQKAATLTDDRAAKLSLFTRIGDTLREQGMNGPACASYLQATAYTDDPDVRAGLERAIDGMTDTEPTAGQRPGLSMNEEE